MSAKEKFESHAVKEDMQLSPQEIISQASMSPIVPLKRNLRLKEWR